MFSTHVSNRHPMAMFNPPGEDRWNAVEVALHMPFFWVQFGQKETPDDDLEIVRTWLLSTSVELESLLAQHQRQEVQLKTVSLVTPGYINGSDGWKLEPLKAIWSCVSASTPELSIGLYEVESGHRYPEPGMEVCEQTLKSAKVRIDLTQLSDTADA